VPIRFVARVLHSEEQPENACALAAIAEDDGGFGLIFQCGLAEPDEQDVALGMDCHCLVTTDGGTAYGCVEEIALDGDVLRIVLDPASLADLELDDAEIEVTLALADADVAELRSGLRRVLGYGRAVGAVRL
jgi:hypothetical protein